VSDALLERCAAVLLDVDGTLTDERLRVPPQSAELVLRIIRSGKRVGIVTSRGIAELDELVRAIAPHGGELREGALTLYTSTGAEAFALEAAGLRPCYRRNEPALEDCLAWLVQRFGELGWERIERHPVRSGDRSDYMIRARGPQATLFFSSRVQADECAGVIATSFPQLRPIRDGGRCVHVVPAGVGKHLALEHAQRGAPGLVLAIADGFALDGEGTPGNDVDLERDGVVCVQVGRRPPRSAEVLFFPPPARAGYEATAIVIEAVALHSLETLRRVSDEARRRFSGA
jgi:HAD superfamily hydrolase (TIGR01484 family)